jgi:hypothetical protein
VDTSKLSTGDIVAGASGIALLIVLFLPWYGVDVNVAGFAAGRESVNAWQAFGLVGLLLFLVAVVAIVLPAARGADALPEDVPGALILLCVGALGLLLVLFRVVDLPASNIRTVGGDSIDYGRKIGLFLGLIATAGITYGGWRANAESQAGKAPAAAPPASPRTSA